MGVEKSLEQDSIWLDASARFSEISLSIMRSLASRANMALDYHLAYSSAFLRFAFGEIEDKLDKGSALNETAKAVNFYQYIPNWAAVSDQELHKHLKSSAFNASLVDYVDSVLEFNRLTNGMYFYTLSAFVSGLDKYGGGIIGAFLEAQQVPHTVVLEVDDVRLLHYINIENNGSLFSSSLPSNSPNILSSFKKDTNTPLLVIYAPVNRYHILDIRKGRSVIEQFVAKGFDVFLLDWGKQWRNMPSMSDYLAYIDQCVEKIKDTTGAKKVSILGYSWGGVLSVIYTSSDRGQKNIKNLILESVHIDFYKDDSILASWFRHLPVEEIAQNSTAIDCRFINLALIMRNPLVHVFDPVIFAMNMSDKSISTGMQFWDDVLRTTAWLADTPVIPSIFFEKLLKGLYKENRLIHKRLEIEAVVPRTDKESNARITTIDLEKITVPILNIIGDFDDICPPAASLPIIDATSSKDKSTIRSPCGHIELCVSTYAHQKLWPQVVEWLRARD